MRKKIFLALMALLVTTLLTFSAFWGLMFSNEIKNLEIKSLSDIKVTLLSTEGEVIFDHFLPIMLVSLLLTLALTALLAHILTKKIISPINQMDLDSIDRNEYEELSPFVRKIQKQKEEIAQHISEIEERSLTIDNITENMREGLLLLDREGMILLSNPAASSIFGLSQLEGRNIIELERDPVFIAHVQDCLEGEKLEIDLEIGYRVYKLLFNPVYNGKEISGAGIFLIDITEKYNFENTRKEFAANVSHELKTPLTTIMGYSEILASGQVRPEDIQNFAGKIQDQSRRLQNIVNDIIYLSEFDEGTRSKDFKGIKLYEVCQTVIGDLEGKAKGRDVEVLLMGLEGARIMGDLGMIESLVYNLLDNAIKYNQPGGQVHLVITEEGQYTKLLVSDTGIGIPDQHKERIFERFYLVDKSRSKKIGGTGLGLSIVKHIMEYHGGHISVNSRENLGTSFHCYFKR